MRGARPDFHGLLPAHADSRETYEFLARKSCLEKRMRICDEADGELIVGLWLKPGIILNRLQALVHGSGVVLLDK